MARAPCVMKEEMSDCGCSSSKAAAEPQGRAPAWHSRLLQHGTVLALRLSAGHRSEQAPSPMEKSMLLFWPWFVECAFQQQYYKTTFGLCDSVCMPLDILIWLIDIVLMLVAGRWWAPLELACTVPPFVAAVACLLYKRRNPDKYRRKRSSITACRRLATLPCLSWVLLRRQPQAIGSWPAALMQLLVLSGGVHTLIASGLFLNSWGVTVLESLASSLMLGSAAPHSCSNILAGPQPHAGWKAAAAVMEKASLGMYSSSVQDPHLEHAVCCTTLNTVLVVCACLAGYTVHWFERQQRLRFKQQMPPAVAAMQPHLFGLPPGLVVAQALLLLLYPAMVLSWIILGAWYGLASGSPGVAINR